MANTAGPATIMKPPSVAITGIGVVSPYGVGRERFWQHVRNGCSATRTITDFDGSLYGCTVAAPVPQVSMDDALAVRRSTSAFQGLAPNGTAGRIRGDIRARRSSA